MFFFKLLSSLVQTSYKTRQVQTSRAVQPFSSEKQLREILLSAEFRNIDLMRNLIESTKHFGYTNQWITSRDRKGRSPLQIASMLGYIKVVTMILKDIINVECDDDLRNSYINFKDYKGRTSLFYATAEGHLGVVKLLVENGADLECITSEKHTQPGSTPLMACAEKNHRDCFDCLIENGADIMATREDGADAIYIAARYGHHEIIERIVNMDESSLVVNRPTFRRRTAFLTAAFHGHKLVCAKLLHLLNDINQKDKDGFTAIMYARNKGDVDLVKWLTQNGAKVEYGVESKDV